MSSTRRDLGHRARFLWYIPNEVRAGHRGDDVVAGHNSLETLTRQALAVETDKGFKSEPYPGDHSLVLVSKDLG